MGKLRVISRAGADLAWDDGRVQQRDADHLMIVQAARFIFTRHVRAGGMAYRVSVPDVAPVRIVEFDDAASIAVIPRFLGESEA